MPEVRYVGSAAIMAKAREALVVAVTEAAQRFVELAESDTPIESGTLRSSETSDTAKASGNTVTAKVHTGGAAQHYAFFVHEGTGVMTGRPYLEIPLFGYGPELKGLASEAVEAAF